MSKFEFMTALEQLNTAMEWALQVQIQLNCAMKQVEIAQSDVKDAEVNVAAAQKKVAVAKDRLNKNK